MSDESKLSMTIIFIVVVSLFVTAAIYEGTIAIPG